MCKISKNTRNKVLNKFGNVCFYCGASATTLDHIVPSSEGGPSLLDNLVPACRACNGTKGQRSLKDFIQDYDALHKTKLKHHFYLTHKKPPTTNFFPIKTPPTQTFSRNIINNIPLPQEKQSFTAEVRNLIDQLKNYSTNNQKVNNTINTLNNIISKRNCDDISSNENVFKFVFYSVKQLLRACDKYVVNVTIKTINYFKSCLASSLSVILLET